MKKLIMAMLVVFVLICLVPQASFAQKGVRWGLMGGINSANIRVSGQDAASIDWKSILGIRGGGFVRIHFHDVVAIQGETFFSQMGSKYEEMILGTNYKEELKLTYIEVPLLVKVVLPTQSSIKPNIFSGSYVALNLDAKATTYIAGVKEGEEDLEDVRTLDYGLVFGAGLDIELGNLMLIFDARYNLGLTKINDPEGLDIAVKNNALVAMLGIGF